MTIAMTERAISAAKPLKDKVSLVTGSTSGIGLGIARALAAAGSAVVLNGFGAPEEVKATQKPPKRASAPISAFRSSSPAPT